MAAGALLWRRDASSGTPVALTAVELRAGKTRHNFIGGKRDVEEETPRAVAAREAHEETGGLLSAAARRAMEGDGAQDGQAMRPALWHAGGKYCLFIHELPREDDTLVERVRARGGTPDSGDPDLLSLQWVPLRTLLDCDWCRRRRVDNLHSFARDQLGLLLPYVALLAQGLPPTLQGRLLPDPLRGQVQAVFVERQQGAETRRVLVDARVAEQEAKVAAVAEAERARLRAQKAQEARAATAPPPPPPAATEGQAVGVPVAAAASDQTAAGAPKALVRVRNGQVTVEPVAATGERLASLSVS